MATLLTQSEQETIDNSLANLIKGTSLERWAQETAAPVIQSTPQWHLSIVHTGDTTVQLRINGYSTLMKFSLKGVETCCAMSFLYGFSVHERIPQEIVDFVLTTVLRKMYQIRYYLTSDRLIINMVGKNEKLYDPLATARIVDDPTVDYKPYWTYFQKHAARVNTMLMPNKNTGRIIHHMEVLFTPEFLKG